MDYFIALAILFLACALAWPLWMISAQLDKIRESLQRLSESEPQGG